MNEQLLHRQDAEVKSTMQTMVDAADKNDVMIPSTRESLVQ